MWLCSMCAHAKKGCFACVGHTTFSLLIFGATLASGIPQYVQLAGTTATLSLNEVFRASHPAFVVAQFRSGDNPPGGLLMHLQEIREKISFWQSHRCGACVFSCDFGRGPTGKQLRKHWASEGREQENLGNLRVLET